MRILIGGKGKMGTLIKETALAGNHVISGMMDAFDLSGLDTMEIPDVVIDFSHRSNLGWIADYNDPITYLELMVTGNSYNYGL